MEWTLFFISYFGAVFEEYRHLDSNPIGGCGSLETKLCDFPSTKLNKPERNAKTFNCIHQKFLSETIMLINAFISISTE